MQGSHKYVLLGVIFFCLPTRSWAQYRLTIIPVDKDSAVLAKMIAWKTSFKNKDDCTVYINNLTATLKAKGYPTASLDSVYYDSTKAIIQLFLGDAFQLAVINTTESDKKVLEQSGWYERSSENRSMRLEELDFRQQKILAYLENNGYPFAKLQLDSFTFEKEKIFAKLNINKGPFYKIDSIRVYGKAVISNVFLQRYLEIRNGSTYQKNKLQNISKRILELPYLEEQQPWNITMLGTGSILNLYLSSKKSSQVNVLIGFLPSNQQTASNKLLVTGEANINLRNALGNGELIGVNWQQIQVKSPRLNLAFNQPYLLGSSLGISTAFDLLKKDSSYLNLSFLLGLQFTLSGEQTGRIFIQNLKSNLLNVDTALLKLNKKLPSEIDVSSINLGIDYEINKTNYRLNPKSGSELQVTMSAGTRNVRRNNVIVKLYDTAFNYASLYDTIQQKSYQFRLKMNAAHYFQAGRQATLKTALNIGWFQSPSVFRNELFQIGGYKLLRGFDEESIFTSSYAVGTLEYRYLIGLNSFLFTFIDAALASNKSIKPAVNNNFIGAGLGLAFETKAGIFNISYAAGKRNDTKFDLRQSKIHLGYVNYF
ncbi:MAG: BamA/TamA family outer membrane protein [Chitinophagaceae bacterium]